MHTHTHAHTHTHIHTHSCTHILSFIQEEQEEGPEPLTGVEDDTPLADGSIAWTPLVSSSSEGVKYQVC